MKKYYFLGGLPRSGNTLLSSILNQNPDIKVSSNSFLNIHLYNTYHLKYSEQYYNFPDSKSLDNLVSSSFDSYYQDWNAKYIIDRGPWGTPFNLQLLQEYLKNEIKIICTVRDIVEIIASFIKTSPEVGFSRPKIIAIVVVLPHPLGPRRPIILPLLISIIPKLVFVPPISMPKQ